MQELEDARRVRQEEEELASDAIARDKARRAEREAEVRAQQEAARRKVAEEVREEVGSLGVHADEVILVAAPGDKARVVDQRGVGILVDDSDECIADVSEDVLVLKVRNGGNFHDGKWWYDERTGKTWDGGS